MTSAECFGTVLYWGFSSATDLTKHVGSVPGGSLRSSLTTILLVGTGDPGHILKTLSEAHCDTNVHFVVAESSLLEIARLLLLLNTILSTENREADDTARIFLDIFGNVKLRSARSAKHLRLIARRLEGWIAGERDICHSFDLSKMTHSERDALQKIFKEWRTWGDEYVGETWDQRVRRHLKSRYDHKMGAFDWDYHMKLKDRGRGSENINAQEYIQWRTDGQAFHFKESHDSEDVLPNPSLLTKDESSHHVRYAGDILASPYLTFGLEDKSTKEETATDISLRVVTKMIDSIKAKFRNICHDFSQGAEGPRFSITFIPERRGRPILALVPPGTVDVAFFSVARAHLLEEMPENAKSIFKDNSGKLLVEGCRFLLPLTKEQLKDFHKRVEQIAHKFRPGIQPFPINYNPDPQRENFFTFQIQDSDD